MIKQVFGNRVVLIFIFLLIWSFLVQSPFQKGGIDQYMHYVIFFLITSLSFVYLFPSEKLILAEKVLYSFILSFAGLFFGLLITSSFLEKIYGDYEMYASNVVSNLIFYFLSVGFTLSILFAIIKIKK
jgi:hypothetical protein